MKWWRKLQIKVWLPRTPGLPLSHTNTSLYLLRNVYICPNKNWSQTLFQIFYATSTHKGKSHENSPGSDFPYPVRIWSDSPKEGEIERNPGSPVTASSKTGISCFKNEFQQLFFFHFSPLNVIKANPLVYWAKSGEFKREHLRFSLTYLSNKTPWWCHLFCK